MHGQPKKTVGGKRFLEISTVRRREFCIPRDLNKY